MSGGHSFLDRHTVLKLLSAIPLRFARKKALHLHLLFILRDLQALFERINRTNQNTGFRIIRSYINNMDLDIQGLVYYLTRTRLCNSLFHYHIEQSFLQLYEDLNSADTSENELRSLLGNTIQISRLMLDLIEAIALSSEETQFLREYFENTHRNL